MVLFELSGNVALGSYNRSCEKTCLEHNYWLYLYYTVLNNRPILTH